MSTPIHACMQLHADTRKTYQLVVEFSGFTKFHCKLSIVLMELLVQNKDVDLVHFVSK